MIALGKKIFLLDGLGALVSLIMLGLVLPSYQKFIGLPIECLGQLAVFALVFFINSLAAYFITKTINNFWLKLVILGNSLYFCFSLWVVVGHFSELTVLGIFYFVAELMILGILIFYEWRILHNNQF